MYNIAICDDDKIIHYQYKNHLYKLASDHNLMIAVDCFTSGEKMLETISHNPQHYHLVILDIYLSPLENGIQISKELRKYNNTLDLIFTSSSKDHVFEAFDALPIYYILKTSVKDDALYELFEKVVLRKLINSEAFITLESKGDIHSIELRKISYIEVKNKTLSIYDTDNFVLVNCPGKLKALEKQLPITSFARIHRGFIVNMSQIQLMTSSEIELKSGAHIPIGRKFRLSVKEQFVRYLSSNTNRQVIK